ncbi:MAG: hypothetical protein ACI9QL_004447 [Candidatus Omnitrophota bacterium]
MKAITYSLMIGLFGLVQACAAGLVVPEPHLELGERYSGEQIEMVFDLENPGEQAIHITGIELGCPACLRYELTGKTIAPGQLEVLNVFFDTTSFKDLVQQTISVHTAEGGSKPLVLSFQVRLASPFHVTPKLPEISLIPGETSQVEVRVQAIRPTLAPISKVVSEHPEFSVELQPVDGDATTVRALISWDGKNLPPGSHTDFFISTADSTDLTGKLRLTHLFPGRLEIQPDPLFFNASRGIQKRMMIITQEPANSMELVSIKVPEGFFRYEVAPVRGKPDYEIYLYGRGLDALPPEDVEIEFSFRGKDRAFTARHPVTLL